MRSRIVGSRLSRTASSLNSASSASTSTPFLSLACWTCHSLPQGFSPMASSCARCRAPTDLPWPTPRRRRIRDSGAAPFAGSSPSATGGWRRVRPAPGTAAPSQGPSRPCRPARRPWRAGAAGHFAVGIRRASQGHHHEVLQHPVAPDAGDRLLVRGFAGADPARVLLLQLQAIEGSGLQRTHTIPLCTCVIITVMVS